MICSNITCTAGTVIGRWACTGSPRKDETSETIVRRTKVTLYFSLHQGTSFFLFKIIQRLYSTLKTKFTLKSVKFYEFQVVFAVPSFVGNPVVNIWLEDIEV